MAYSAMPTDMHAITVAGTPDDPFTATYKRYRGMVRWAILDKLGNNDAALADDLTQETFLRLFQYRERIEFGPRIAGLLKLMARQSVGRHYAVMRNTRELPADTGHWSYSNRNLATSGTGYYTPAATGFRTAQIGGAR